MKRIVAPALVAAILLTAPLQAGVVKTKTKSNQSNDRCAGVCPVPRSEAEAALAEAFTRLDADASGALVDSEEAGIAVERSNGGATDRSVIVKFIVLRPGEARLAFTPDLDADGDGRISRAEWLADGLAQLDRADTDHDGTLNAAELRAASWDIKSSQIR